VCFCSFAVSPGAVQRALKAGAPLTFIDVRASATFQQGHIPNAINIPAPVVALKQLPPLGRVVVYDDGLTGNAATAAAAALNQKSGITAEVLEGGFAAWQTAQAPTTQARGMEAERMPMITYDELKKSTANDLVLVDLRAGPPVSAAPVQKTAAAPLTDLKSEFPNARIARSPFEAGPAKSTLAGGAGMPPLLVLIDSGDGSAQAMARALKANGTKRFVVLAGGEEILQRKGQSGLQRIGGTLTVRKPAGEVQK
jgi:rhodanese-related sulfurtransferase